MKMTMILIVIGALGIVTKELIPGLEDLEIRGQVGTIQITALLRSARILIRVPETCCHTNSSESPSANVDAKKLSRSNNNSNNDPEDLRRLAVTQTPVKNQQLTLM